MLVRWNLSRYARCYENSQEQYSDCQGRPLFDLLPCIQQCVRMSQTFNSQHLPSSANFKQPPGWSAINSSNLNLLYIELSIESCDRASLSVKCKPWESTTTDDQSINLEYLEFPSIASLPGFKVSPRETSLGFRYPSKSSVI